MSDAGTKRTSRLPRIGPREIGAAFPASSRFERAYLWARYLVCPFDEVGQAIPETGRILDVGCGFGFFSVHLHLQSNEREVLGVDHDEARIRAANAHVLPAGAAGGRPGAVRFEVADVATADLEACDAIVLVDVLHHLPQDAVEDLLARIRLKLRPGGRLIVKDLDTRPWFEYVWNWVHDAVMTRSLRFWYRSRADTEALLERAGFSDVRSRRVPVPVPYAHVLYTASQR